MKIQNGFSFLVLVNPDCPEKETIERVLLLGCIACTECLDVARSVVCVCVGHNHELCKNG